MTSRFVAKSVLSVTPGSLATASIAVPLAEANTSAVPSLWICEARSVDDPKLKVTVIPGFAAAKSLPIRSKAAVSEDAANTVSAEDAAEPELLVPLHPAATSKVAIATVFLIAPALPP